MTPRSYLVLTTTVLAPFLLLAVACSSTSPSSQTQTQDGSTKTAAGGTGGGTTGGTSGEFSMNDVSIYIVDAPAELNKKKVDILIDRLEVLSCGLRRQPSR